MKQPALLEQTSFYCNRCDKWVDGIDDSENEPVGAGVKQVLCSECGSAILYRPASLWTRLRHTASDLLVSTFSPRRK